MCNNNDNPSNTPKSSGTAITDVTTITIDIPVSTFDQWNISMEDFSEEVKWEFTFGRRIRENMNEIANLRNEINQSCRMTRTDPIFPSNVTTDRYSHELLNLRVENELTLRRFIVGLNNYLIQGANYRIFRDRSRVNSTLRKITRYRIYFEHDVDTHEQTRIARDIGNINERFTGSKILTSENYPSFQLNFLIEIKETLQEIRNNIT